MAAAAWLAKLRELPVRTTGFTGRPGPVGWMTFDNARTGGPQMVQGLLERQMQQGRTSFDIAADLEWHKEGSGALEAPPSTVTYFPVLDCGGYVPEEGQTRRDAMDTFANGTAVVAEKGYVPHTVAGTSDVLLAQLEGIKKVNSEEIVMLHFAADARLHNEDDAVRQALDRKLIKGLVQFGTRANTKPTRAQRKKHEIRYVDAYGLFHKGTFTVKDIRNNYPLYISVDLGVLDPSVAPGVEDPESGGVVMRELLHLISVIRGSRIVGVDVHGFDPRYDVKRGAGDGLTALAATKIAKELIGRTYTMSTMTSVEGYSKVQENRHSGQHPGDYPD